MAATCGDTPSPRWPMSVHSRAMSESRSERDAQPSLTSLLDGPLGHTEDGIMGGPWGQSEPGGRMQCLPLWCTTPRSMAASRLRMEGRKSSSNTIGIPRMEWHQWAEGRGVPAIWFGSNKVRTRSANFAGGRMLNGTEHSNQGPSQTLNGMERSVRGVRGSNLGSELNFSITNRVSPVGCGPCSSLSVSYQTSDSSCHNVRL